MKRELVKTADGSTTIYLPEWNEHYHSSHGALQEAQHVFIKHGLNPKTEDYLTIFEMGFGTGLNALLTYFASEKRHQYVHYIGLEAYPPAEAEIKGMNYTSFSNDPEAVEIFNKLHRADWNTACEISEHFVLEKIGKQIQELELEKGSIDLCYYDAFGPRVQPELWTPEIFAKIYDWLSPDGVLVTYCAKGQMKRDLKSVGFEVLSLPGPPGKREMTKAIKSLRRPH
ncbi:tRNA (5-methylaminomethyl-2-thiouridine)(34)-methyltransferase MnmD [Fluviicola sp.]|jgi:tRNA U34 5-methylaminomethyl-2-thiouridine-forming methyltransferase MnmC|uniref:tRNA (5-methylaminomethyl-2-thiouridine)(34)-methyltransferase MnmD n=1 Tax=Fluviicola sp. TaxID=1917219 RepID=UPI002827CB3F|nr:tRNA (5-methylaminomethyl-2-thiouridine)(34)-methyltransferase MnmD [Fluviicola sp.]MDR0802413.1 tRNA (5-methylaminomethyl-2-thiouridine)(34)-methyltransferase MnmD [Fluviicola sp.]